MCSTAKLHGITIEFSFFASDLNHANDVAVFVSKKLLDVFASLNVDVFDFCPENGIGSGDAIVHLEFDGVELFAGEGA